MVTIIRTILCAAALTGVVLGIDALYEFPDFPWYFWVSCGGLCALFSNLGGHS